MSGGGRVGVRGPGEMRVLKITPDFVGTADGSVFIELGGTRVLCSVQVVNGVPGWRRGSGAGWLTAEYSLLPSSTRERTPREAVRGKQGGRTVEIQRFIGRSLRAVLDMEALGERTVYVDCDVVEADGGTRCAAVSGGYLALHLALKRCVDKKTLRTLPLNDSVAAISVGVVGGVPVVDLEYQEDCGAEVDMNVVMTGNGRLIEVQATAETHPFERSVLDELLDLAQSGIEAIKAAQMEVVARVYAEGTGAAGGCPAVVTDSLTIVLATHNPGKAREFRRLLGDSYTLDLVPEWVALPEETGRTFAENARLKAEGVFAAIAGASGVLADDSGLEVDALGGRPGVLSARYWGERARDEDNVNKLLADLHGQTARGARFVCALCLALPSPRPGGRASPRTVEVRGVVEGTIAEAARGSRGFGYDPVFLPAGGDGTLAEIPAAAKDKISHRGAAVEALLARLRAEGLVSGGS